MTDVDIIDFCVKIFEATSLRQLDSIMEKAPRFFCKDGDHVFDQVTRKRNAAGNYVLRSSCSKCGQMTGSFLKYSEVTSSVPYNQEEIDRKFSFHRMIQSAYNQQKSMLWFHNRQEITDEYKKYLESWEWSDKAYKVKKRANFICEGCLEAPATEVHHTTYTHIYNEFMFELLALCSSCHRRIHGRSAE